MLKLEVTLAMMLKIHEEPSQYSAEAQCVNPSCFSLLFVDTPVDQIHLDPFSLLTGQLFTSFQHILRNNMNRNCSNVDQIIEDSLEPSFRSTGHGVGMINIGRKCRHLLSSLKCRVDKIATVLFDFER